MIKSKSLFLFSLRKLIPQYTGPILEIARSGKNDLGNLYFDENGNVA
jgi:hypothetical protein